MPVLLLAQTRSLVGQETQAEADRPATPPGGSDQTFAPANALTPRPGNLPRLNAFVNYAYVAPGEAKFQGSRPGNSDAQSAHVGALGAIPLNENWFVPLGLGSGNFFLESLAGTPVPDQIHTLHLLAGLGHRFNDDWTVSASLGPAFYRLDEISSGDVGISGMISALHRVRPNFLLALGIGFNPDSDIPVLPAAGVRWDIRTNLTLNLMFPRPVLLYRVAPKLNLFAGGDIKFAVFRAENNLGDKIGQPTYNHALGTYRDFHLGAGADYEIVRRLSLSVEGGYSVGREIDYKRIGERVQFDPSPYGQVGVRYRF